jgi:hypothetical protein
MKFPPDKEYERLVRELNEMYDVFYRSKSGGYDEYYEREAAMDAAQHGHLLNDFLSGNIEKLATEHPSFFVPIGEEVADNIGMFDRHEVQLFQRLANELFISLDYLAMIPAEIMDEDYRNHLYEQISRELSRNQTKMISNQPVQLQSLKSNPEIQVTRYHAQTSKGVLPFLVVSEYGYSNIYLPASFEAMANPV